MINLSVHGNARSASEMTELEKQLDQLTCNGSEEQVQEAAAKKKKKNKNKNKGKENC